MSTYGSIEQAIRDLDRASERVGYLLERANREGAADQDRARAEEAVSARQDSRTALLAAINEHANAQYEAGLDMGRSDRRSA